MIGAAAALAQKAPAPERAPTPDLTSASVPAALGQVTPLGVETFGGRAEPVAGTGDRAHLAYELRLTNITASALAVERVRVLDPSRGGRAVEELSGDEVASRLVVFGKPLDAADKRFGPGVAGLLFMDVTYPPARGCRTSSSTASTSRPARPPGWPTASGPVRRAWPRKIPPVSARRSSGSGG